MLRDGVGAKFWICLGTSVVLHGVLGGAIVWAQSQQPAPLRFAESMPVQLVKLGKKRDPELLPRLSAPPPPPKEEGVSLAPKDPKNEKKVEKKPEKKPEKLSDAAERLLNSSPSELDRVLAKVEADEGAEDGDEAGTTTDPAQAAAGYQRALIVAIRRAYVLPEAIPQSQRGLLKARVVLFIDPSGAIREFQFTEKHPNELFMGALEKLLSSLQLPAPPKELVATVSRDGVEIIFRP